MDAVIGYYTLGAGGRGYLQEVARVLKPGCPFVFIDRGLPPGSSPLDKLAFASRLSHHFMPLLSCK